MGIATLTEKGQIIIPRAIRKMFGLTAHQKILFVPRKEGVELIPVKGNLMSLYGTFHSRRVKKVEDWQAVRSTVRRRLVAGRSRGA